MSSSNIFSLPYIDIQHDALAVFDDVAQGIVMGEEIWISAYKAGSSSVHGKARVEVEEGGGVQLTPIEGVQVAKTSRTQFLVSVPSLGLESVSVRFPRQTIHPPYKQTTSLTPPLQINSLAYSHTVQRLVVGGPDGYCAVLPTGPEAKVSEESVVLKGHVGDVLNVKFFPSGQVILTAASDLSLRVFGLDGLNPRTLKGHTRGVTCTAILGVGKQVISGSKDGSVRLWDVGAGEEVQRWETEGRAPVEAVVLLDLPESLLDVRVQEGQWGILAFTQSGGVEMFLPSSTDRKGEWRTSLDVEGRVASVAYDRASGFLATGHMSGIISLRALSSLSPGPTEKKGSVALVRRNESPVYSLEWAEGDLLVGTAAGLPCRLGVRKRQEGTEEQVEAEGGKWEVWVKEEMAGWEAVGIEGFAVGPEGVWAAGDEGGVRRY